jgi:putative endonuclease
MIYYVYALKSKKDGHLYIGLSECPERRLIEHNKGMCRSTKSRAPFILIYTERCMSRKEAREKEKKFKTGSGREFLKNLMLV